MLLTFQSTYPSNQNARNVTSFQVNFLQGRLQNGIVSADVSQKASKFCEILFSFWGNYSFTRLLPRIRTKATFSSNDPFVRASRFSLAADAGPSNSKIEGFDLVESLTGKWNFI